VLTHSRYDLNPTFDVAVGSEIFSLHTSVFTGRSEFFRAARKPQWLAGSPKKPVDLKDEDPRVFNEYMNCVYFGQEGLKHYADNIKSTAEVDRTEPADAGFEALIRVYLLADKLQDLDTTNVVIDEIMRFSDTAKRVPCSSNYHLVYDNTTPHSRLRVLMRDFWMYEMDEEYDKALDALPQDLMQDILGEFLRVKRARKHATVKEAFNKDLSTDLDSYICFYHQHDGKHSRCGRRSKFG
jgi:hypothetical protein